MNDGIPARPLRGEFADEIIEDEETRLARGAAALEAEVAALAGAIELKTAEAAELQGTVDSLQAREKTLLTREALGRGVSLKEVRTVQESLVEAQEELAKRRHDIEVLNTELQRLDGEFQRLDGERERLRYRRVVSDACRTVETSAGRVSTLVDELHAQLQTIGQAAKTIRDNRGPLFNPSFLGFRWDNFVQRTLHCDSADGWTSPRFWTIWTEESAVEVEELTREPDPPVEVEEPQVAGQ